MKKIKVALVTGGSRGIGSRISLALAKEGFSIGINFLQDFQAAKELAAQVMNQGVKALLLPGNISKREQVEDIVKKVTETWGKIDVLVNNAGINRDSLLINMEESDWDAVINTNLKGTFMCSQIAGDAMSRQQGGSIINISSIVGLTGRAGQANYSTSKAEVIGLTKQFACELAPYNIRVNAVIPSFIQSNMTAQISEKALQNILKKALFKKPGAADDVARMVNFLVDEKNAYISGQLFNVDCRIV